MYFLINKNDDFSFLWFREDKSDEITNLFTYFCDPQISEFTQETLLELPNDHRFVVFIENPFEKVLYDAIQSKSFNFETFLTSIRKNIDSQLSIDFKNLIMEKTFFLNIHNIDMEELEKIIDKKWTQTNTIKSTNKPKQFQNKNAKLYRQPFKDIRLFHYDFQLHQFYNKKLQNIVLKVYAKDFDYFKQNDIHFENPIMEYESIAKSNITRTNIAKSNIEEMLDDKEPYYKAKSEMQRIINKIGYCHLYDDYYMFIDKKGQVNLSRDLVDFSTLENENEFVDRNFNHVRMNKKK